MKKSAPRHPHIAFTLIELLIVVAIIAILAAIAVPNFLEAQTRSKVSRAMADIRSISVGVECYNTDWNRYPSPNRWKDPDGWMGPQPGGKGFAFGWWYERVVAL